MSAPSSTSAPGSIAPAAVPSPYDWRRRCRRIPPGAARRGLPAVDVAWSALFLVVAYRNLDFILDYGAYTVYVLNLALCLGLALIQLVRLTRLRAVFIATYALLAAYALLVVLSPVNLGVDPIIITAVTTLHAVTRWEPDRRWGTAALLLALAGAVINPATIMAIRFQAASTGILLIPLMLLCLAFVGAVIVTYLHASSRRRAAEDHAQEVRSAVAAASSAATAAVATERLSMARELHDLVGHSLTAVTVQASTGLALGEPEQMRSALESVRETASASLGSVRELVRALRSQAHQTTALADLLTIPDLIATTRSAGRRVEAELPEQAELEAWSEHWSMMQRLTLVRLVGEALTNAVKHGSGPIGMRLGLHQGHCHLEVINARSPERRDIHAQGATAGHGLIGLEERLRLVGGRLEASFLTLPDGAPGFRLRASFPVNASPGPAPQE